MGAPHHQHVCLARSWPRVNQESAVKWRLADPHLALIQVAHFLGEPFSSDLAQQFVEHRVVCKNFVIHIPDGIFQKSFQVLGLHTLKILIYVLLSVFCRHGGKKYHCLGAKHLQFKFFKHFRVDTLHQGTL